MFCSGRIVYTTPKPLQPMWLFSKIMGNHGSNRSDGMIESIKRFIYHENRKIINEMVQPTTASGFGYAILLKIPNALYLLAHQFKRKLIRSLWKKHPCIFQDIYFRFYKLIVLLLPYIFNSKPKKCNLNLQNYKLILLFHFTWSTGGFCSRFTTFCEWRIHYLLSISVGG